MPWLPSDHAYTKHWSESYLTENSHVLPLKEVLNSEDIFDSYSKSSSSEEEISDDEIDVETVSDSPAVIGSSSWHCAEQKARMQMNECERHVTGMSKGNPLLFTDERESVWEENINKSSWGVLETKIFNKVVKILQSEKLSRLAYKGMPKEIVLRRLSVDKSASCLREALADIGWPIKITQWLHLLLIENLPMTLLSYYLDIMQTLRSKVPSLIERMIMPSRDTGSAATERLGILLKRPWDPAVTAVVSDMKQKLNQRVLFIVVQCTVSQSTLPVTSRRLRFWNSLLSQIGKVVQVGATMDDNDGNTDKASWTVQELAETTLRNVCNRVRELSVRNANRKVVLIGWHTASLINCHVALTEHVSAVVCLGFPLYNMFGQRGSVDDVLCEMKRPTLFIIGDKSSSCRINDLEDRRLKSFTNAVTQSVLIHGADDWLRITEKMKLQNVVTQSMVDRLILEGICEFLLTIYSPAGEALEKASAGTNNSKYFAEVAELERKHGTTNSPGSSQLNQFLSNQKHSEEGKRQSSKLQGLSFNLQTGSISGLTSVPGSDVNRSDAGSRFRGHGSSSRSKSPAMSGEQSSRSITIDLTKDPNSQLPSALSKRKSQFLSPTESQTEAAVAAILGSPPESKINSTPPQASISAASPGLKKRMPHTTVLSTSSSFGRYSSSGARAPNAAHVDSATPSFSLTLGGSIGKLSTQSMKPKPEATSSTGTPGSFIERYQSFVASRSRREDRETLQATSILEQLTSSLDAGKEPTSRSASPEELSGSLMSQLDSSRRHSFDNVTSRGSQPYRPRGSRVRTRGSSRPPRGSSYPKKMVVGQSGSGGMSSEAQTGDAKNNVVRYVLSSGGLTAAQSRSDNRHITFMQNKKSFQVSPQPRNLTVTSQSKFTPHKSMMPTATSALKRASSTPLVDLVLGSATASDSSSSTKRPTLPGQIQKSSPSGAGSSQRSSVKLAPKLFDLFPGNVSQKSQPTSGRSVVYLRDKSMGGTRNLEAKLIKVIKNQKKPMVSPGPSKSITKVQMTPGKAGERHMLSITRPRPTVASQNPEKSVQISTVAPTPTTPASTQGEIVNKSLDS
ncbi:uncharacterized protein LOC100178064 [Ciona intestinalis]